MIDVGEREGGEEELGTCITGMLKRQHTSCSQVYPMRLPYAYEPPVPPPCVQAAAAGGEAAPAALQLALRVVCNAFKHAPLQVCVWGKYGRGREGGGRKGIGREVRGWEQVYHIILRLGTLSLHNRGMCQARSWKLFSADLCAAGPGLTPFPLRHRLGGRLRLQT